MWWRGAAVPRGGYPPYRSAVGVHQIWDNITGVQLAYGTGTAKVHVKGKGSGLDVPGPLPLVYGTDVTVQLGRSYTRRCWSATHATPPRTNTTASFGDVTP